MSFQKFKNGLWTWVVVLVFVFGAVRAAAVDVKPEKENSGVAPGGKKTAVMPPGADAKEVPYWPTEGWRISTPEEQGIESRKLAEALDHILNEEWNVHSLLLIRNGYVVMDAVFNYFTPDTKHDIASVTKSITATLIGVALRKGLIKDLEQPVLGFFPDWNVANLDSRKKEMTLQDVLTMRAGLECIYSPTEVTLFQMMGSPDWIQFMLDLHMTDNPGEKYAYNSGAIHVLSAVIRQSTGKSALEFAREELLEPLGISDIVWPMDPQGVSNYGWGSIRMKPHDMAKLGYLYMNKGTWDDRQIFSPHWVENATKKHMIFKGGGGYGYLWWIPEGEGYYASGRGGQVIYVLPEKNLIVVMTGGGLPLSNFGLLEKAVLPAALASDAPLPPDPEGVALLEDVIKKAALGKHVDARSVSPLPPIAREISGKTFALQPNQFGIMSLMLQFPGSDEAWMKLNLALDTDRNPTYRIGLDGVPRIGAARFGIPASGTGEWTSNQTFSIHINEIGNINSFDITLNFEGKNVHMTFSENTGLGSAVIEGRIAE